MLPGSHAAPRADGRWEAFRFGTRLTSVTRAFSLEELAADRGGHWRSVDQGPWQPP